MRTYEAYNYSMGRVVESVRFEAYTDMQAIITAERRLRGSHALVQGGKRGRVIGVKLVKLSPLV